MNHLDSVLILGGVNSEFRRLLVIRQPAPSGALHSGSIGAELVLHRLKASKVLVDLSGQVANWLGEVVARVWLHVGPEDGVVEVSATVEHDSVG